MARIDHYDYHPDQPTRAGGGHPLMRGKPKPAAMFDPFPEGGGYPIGFPEWAMETLECDNPDAVLHLCSGSMQRGTTVDIRPEKNPTIVADCRNVPLADESFRWIMADPPYSETYAENLYRTGKDYPRPGTILKEAYRLLEMGGRVGILHFLVPQVIIKGTPKAMALRGVWGVCVGTNNNIRAWTVYEKVA